MSEWISINTKLPKDGELVIITGYDWGNEKNNRHFGICEHYQNVWIGDQDEEFEYVTHWIPLPEPPK